MKRVARMAIYPAACCACGTTEGEGIDLDRNVDIGIEKPYELYLCVACARQVGGLGDMTLTEDVDIAFKARDAALTELEQHRERANALEEVIRSLGDSKVLQRCETCQWTGKSVAQHARHCDLDVCPYRKVDTEEAVA